MTDLTSTTNAITTNDHTATFERIKTAALATLSKRSQRVYADTYDNWHAYAVKNDLSPLAFDYIHVKPFIQDTAATLSTAQRMLSAMRTLARTAVLELPQAPEFERLYSRLKTWKVKADSLTNRDDNAKRSKHVLTSEQVYAAVNVWSDDDVRSQRNRALLRVLFYAGLRRFEAAALRWSDVDLTNGLINVVAGKGREDDEPVPLLTGEAVEDLRTWHQVMSVQAPGNPYVFPSMRRGGKLLDSAMSGEAVRMIVKETEAVTGVAFNPHDARRTIITWLVDKGNSLKDVQAFARHKHAQTTMIYAKHRGAKELSERLEL